VGSRGLKEGISLTFPFVIRSDHPSGRAADGP
jgi:hypothetical protein